MRKKIILYILALCIITGSGCGNKSLLNEISSSDNIEDNQLSLPSQVESEPELQSSGKVINEPQTFMQLESEIKKYLSMTTEEITMLTGCKIDKDGTYVVFEPHIFYPCIYLKDSPFYIICRTWDDEDKPAYIDLYDYSIILSEFNLKKEMNFAEIMEVMGPAEIQQSLPLDEERVEETSNYLIEYEYNGLTYVFCADNREGNLFMLYIAEANNL
jgi:YHS domain-containing protein